MPRVLAASRFVARQRELDPARSERWLNEGFFEQTAVPALELGAEAWDELRRFRNAQMVRIAFRDIAGWASLDETLGALSDLAETCCQQALHHAGAELERIHGAPSAAPVILGLGKLGGRELNFSSDIDLILCFTESGETAGPRKVSNEEYFGKLAQAFTRLLSERTAEGFVFRIDWMLRPFGSAGAPAMSFAAIEEYYQTHGREWERYALIKARPIAGDLAAGKKLLESLRPFIYRRYLDFNAIGHLRELKARIDDDARAHGREDDLKVGAGGIREIEFIVQSFQLMRGGQEARLRDSRLRPVLTFLGESGLLPPEIARSLDEAYVFLRRAENAVQMYEDEQTHRLPTADAARCALCAALGFERWDVFAQPLGVVRNRVHTEFRRLFGEPRPLSQNATAMALGRLWAQGDGGFDEPLTRALTDLRDSPLARAQGEVATGRLLGAIAALIDDARLQTRPQTALLRSLEVVSAIAGRSTYLALLRDSPTARTQLLQLCAASPWATHLLAQAPALLDQLLDSRALHTTPERDELRSELSRLAAGIPAGDTEGAMNLLRRYVQETTLRIAAADLAGALPLVKVSDRLTWLAEAVVEQALLLARQDLQPQYGAAQSGMAVVGYGKFGGIELGYGSDLDLVFIHGSTTPEGQTAGGQRSLSHAEYFARWLQRTVNLLSARTHRGRAYEVDLELRPSGASGPAAVSFTGFAEYQRERAWTWEHQALTRARFVAGDQPLGAAFEALRHGVLRRPRDPVKLREEVVTMRAKMLANLDRSGAGRFDVKQGRGGVTDIEFIAQYLVLRDAARAPALTEWSDNWRQLEALEAAGSVSGAQKDMLIGVYRNYRAHLHAASLQNEDTLVDDARFTQERAQVRALWDFFLGERQ